MNVGTARSTQLCERATRAEGSFWSGKVAEHEADHAGETQREDDRHRQRDQDNEADDDGGDEDYPESPAARPQAPRPLKTSPRDTRP